MATALVPVIGYDAAAQIAKTAWSEGRTVREVVEESGVLSKADIPRVLDAMGMTEPGLPGSPTRR